MCSHVNNLVLISSNQMDFWRAQDSFTICFPLCILESSFDIIHAGIHSIYPGSQSDERFKLTCVIFMGGLPNSSWPVPAMLLVFNFGIPGMWGIETCGVGIFLSTSEKFIFRRTMCRMVSGRAESRETSNWMTLFYCYWNWWNVLRETGLR